MHLSLVVLNIDVCFMMLHFYLVRFHIIVIFVYFFVVFCLTVTDHVYCQLDTI